MVKPSELVEEAISRIEKLNSRLNAVIHKMYDLAQEAAEGDLPDGTFRGVPFLTKDLLETYACMPTCSGSRFHQGFVPNHDSEVFDWFTRQTNDAELDLEERLQCALCAKSRLSGSDLFDLPFTFAQQVIIDPNEYYWLVIEFVDVD